MLLFMSHSTWIYGDYTLVVMDFNKDEFDMDPYSRLPHFVIFFLSLSLSFVRF